MRRPVAVLAAVGTLAGGCAPGGREPVRASAATADQMRRYGVAPDVQVLLELRADPGRPGTRRAVFGAPGDYSVAAVCDGKFGINVSVNSRKGRKDVGGSYQFRCGRPPRTVALQARPGDRVDVKVFDNDGGDWSVLFFAPR